MWLWKWLLLVSGVVMLVFMWWKFQLLVLIVNDVLNFLLGCLCSRLIVVDGMLVLLSRLLVSWIILMWLQKVVLYFWLVDLLQVGMLLIWKLVMVKLCVQYSGCCVLQKDMLMLVMLCIILLMLNSDLFCRCCRLMVVVDCGVFCRVIGRCVVLVGGVDCLVCMLI